MKRLLIGLIMLLMLPSAGRNQRDVACSIELSIERSKKNGQLVSVVGKIENRSDRKLYFERMRYLRTDILKQAGNKFVDFNEGWYSFEVLNRDQTGTELGESVPKSSVFNNSKGEFTDSLAKAFYHEHISNQRLIKSAKDSTTLRDWTTREFDGIIFLKPTETFRKFTSINSLPQGSYKIVYSYTNVNDTQAKNRLPNLALPKVLNGFEGWSGTVVSDTLFFVVK